MITIELGHKKYELKDVAQAQTLVDILGNAREVRTSFAQGEGERQIESYVHYTEQKDAVSFELEITSKTAMSYEEAKAAIETQEREWKEKV